MICKTCKKESNDLVMPEYRPRECANCYVKRKVASKTKNGFTRSKWGNWICSGCNRTHPTRKNFCFECGKSKEEASWTDKDAQLINNDSDA
jgi:hypothetical protein